MDRRWSIVTGSLAGLLLVGCREAAPPQTPAQPVAKAPVAPAAAPAEPPREVLRQAVVVEPAKPAAAKVLLSAGTAYVVYAAPLDPQQPADPHLTVRNHRGEVLGESGAFRNELFAAVPVVLDYESEATVEVACDDRKGGSISLRVQAVGRLSPGQSTDGVLADFQTFQFYAVDAQADQRFEAATSELGPGGDTLLTIHRFQDLAIIAENDDASPDDTASEVLWRSREAGRQVIAVTSWTQEGASSYRLSLQRLQVAEG